MNGYSFQFCGIQLMALPTGALWWAESGVLCVSDLHLGKSERVARLGGGLLPPYEAEDTLARLADDLDVTGARVLVSLGDSFDDLAAADGLTVAARARLAALQAGRRWIWIAGNHDPGPLGLGGEHLAELPLDPLVFRHEAMPGALGEVSGHYHPKVRVARTSVPAFLVDAARLILPAYGTYTGGLRSDHVALAGIMGEDARAILTGKHMAAIPMPGARERALP